MSTQSTFRLDLPEVFTGEDGKNFGQWVRRLEVAAGVLPQSDKLHLILPSRLAGAAFTVWESIPASDQKDYSLVKKKLASVFGNTNYLTTFKSCIDARKRQRNESLEVFAAAITTLVEEAFPKYDAAGKDGEKFRRFVAGIDKALQVKIHEMGATTFDEALDIAVRVERASLIGQTWTPLDQTIASTSSKTDALTSEVLEKVLHRLDEMELNLGKLQSKSSLHRSLSPRQHSASSYTHEHQSRPKHRHFDDQRHQPFRSFSPQRSPSPHRRFTSPAPPYNSHPRFRSPSPQRSYYSNQNSNRSQSPQHYQRRPSPSRHNSYYDGRSSSPSGYYSQSSSYPERHSTQNFRQPNWQSTQSDSRHPDSHYPDSRHPDNRREPPFRQMNHPSSRRVHFDDQGNDW